MSGRLALVTGASSGIGAGLARVYASHGYDLAITARRADRLEALADEARLRHGVEVTVIPADLADPGAPGAILGEIAAHGRTVDALVNNAGYGTPGPYPTGQWGEEEAFLRVMTVAVCELTHGILPGMAERRFGRIVNVASLAGLIPGAPGTALYGAVKAFLVRYSQSLHLENRATGVHVTALCPGFTYTEFHDVNGTRAQMAGQAPAWLWMGADEVAAAGYEAAEANRPLCVTGAPNQAIAAAAKILPDEWGMALMTRRPGRQRGKG
ncbi:MAG: SDR family oxidoreductase [Caulobacteraceae bacterium]|nr:SDR family oxidoreductase [Caulobacteraceae bacterium]